MLVRAVCLLLLMLTCTGCAGLGLTAAASAIGSVGSALDTGTSVYQNGKLDSAEMATLDQCTRAIRAAAEELGLRIMTDKPAGHGKYRMAMVDDRDKVIDIWLDQRSKSLARLRIDVGLFGSEPTARLILGRFRLHLAKIRGDPTTRQTRRDSSDAARHVRRDRLGDAAPPAEAGGLG
jgi:hypothetical protein